jgi:hypothetical protein
MTVEFMQKRLRPFEGLCLLASDLADEQTYHRQNLHRHTLFLHGHGIVQGLQVELQQSKKQYVAVVQAGYGVTALGQGVQLGSPAQIPLRVPKEDGEYMLWLFHTETPAEGDSRPVYDTTESKPARVVEGAAPRLHPAGGDEPDAVALCRINVRLGRMVQVQLPVPRSGRQTRAAESYLKPRVADFVRLNRKVLQYVFRTALLKELDIFALQFSSALVSAEFLLIEEGTSDRVLYQTAGSLINYGHDFFSPLPKTTSRIDKFKKFIQRVHAETPAADQNDDVWLKWFDKFERLLQPLEKIVTELEQTIEAQR